MRDAFISDGITAIQINPHAAASVAGVIWFAATKAAQHGLEPTIQMTPTAGSFLSMGARGAFMTIGKLLSQGGWAMWPIYLCSFVALFFFCERFIYYWRIRAKELVWLDPVLERVQQQDLGGAVKLCQHITHPIADVLEQGTRMAQQRPERAAAEAERTGMLALARYERFLPLLSFIAQVAPLLGLLGTVLGMVEMFYGLQQAGLANIDASQLSKGIWKALLTTAAGLIVAAPTLAAYMYLTSRLDRFRGQLQDVVSRWLSALPSQPAGQPVPSQPERPQDV